MATHTHATAIGSSVLADDHMFEAKQDAAKAQQKFEPFYCARNYETAQKGLTQIA